MTSSAKHTPGPWEVDGFAISAGSKTICVMGEIDGFERGYSACDNSEANGRLIAAAPDLIQALASYLVLGAGKCTIGKAQADAAYAAIIKATSQPVG